jgi:hypothetical protein
MTLSRRVTRMGRRATDDVTIGELCRRVDRFEAAMTDQLRDLQRTIADRAVPVDLWREADGEYSRRIGSLESAMNLAERRFRSTVVTMAAALASGLGGIIVSALTAHSK